MTQHSVGMTYQSFFSWGPEELYCSGLARVPHSDSPSAHHYQVRLPHLGGRLYHHKCHNILLLWLIGITSSVKLGKKCTIVGWLACLSHLDSTSGHHRQVCLSHLCNRLYLYHHKFHKICVDTCWEDTTNKLFQKRFYWLIKSHFNSNSTLWHIFCILELM